MVISASLSDNAHETRGYSHIELWDLIGESQELKALAAKVNPTHSKNGGDGHLYVIIDKQDDKKAILRFADSPLENIHEELEPEAKQMSNALGKIRAELKQLNIRVEGISK